MFHYVHLNTFALTEHLHLYRDTHTHSYTRTSIFTHIPHYIQNNNTKNTGFAIHKQTNTTEENKNGVKETKCFNENLNQKLITCNAGKETLKF